MKDIFGGETDKARQPDENDHFWVGIGTEGEHCMRCMRGLDFRGERCKLHPPFGHPGGPQIEPPTAATLRELHTHGFYATLEADPQGELSEAEDDGLRTVYNAGYQAGYGRAEDAAALKRKRLEEDLESYRRSHVRHDDGCATLDRSSRGSCNCTAAYERRHVDAVVAAEHLKHLDRIRLQAPVILVGCIVAALAVFAYLAVRDHCIETGRTLQGLECRPDGATR